MVATAPAEAPAEGAGPPCDFISRWFGPLSGIPEDPVTGSAHTTLAPFWAQRLGKTSMLARQARPGRGFWPWGRGGGIDRGGAPRADSQGPEPTRTPSGPGPRALSLAAGV